ncbi:MAG: hypothetical protein ABH952_02155 [Candidatus Omnitrophota bacterium]
MCNLKHNILFKLIVIVLIHAFLCLDLSWAAGGNLRGLTAHLAPALKVADQNVALTVKAISVISQQCKNPKFVGAQRAEPGVLIELELDDGESHYLLTYYGEDGEVVVEEVQNVHSFCLNIEQNNSNIFTKLLSKKLSIISALSFALTAMIFIFYRDNTAITPFLPYLAPAVVIMGMLILYEFVIKKEHSTATEYSLSRRRTIIAGLFGLMSIFFTNLGAVNLLYIFSKDKSFQAWKYGYPKIEEIARLRPVGTEQLSSISLPDSDKLRKFMPVVSCGLRVRKIDAVHIGFFVNRLRDLNLRAEITEEKARELIGIVNAIRPKYISYREAFNNAANRLHGVTVGEVGYVEIEEIVSLIPVLNPERFSDWRSQWAAAGLRLVLLELYGLYRYYRKYYRRIDESGKHIVDPNIIEFLEYIESFIDIPYLFTSQPDPNLGLSNQFLSLSDTYRFRLLSIFYRGSFYDIFQDIKQKDYDEFVLEKLEKIEKKIENEIKAIELKGTIRRDLDDVAYAEQEFETVYSGVLFRETLTYYERLQRGPVRPLSIEHLEALKEARRILLPLIVQRRTVYHRISWQPLFYIIA